MIGRISLVFLLTFIASDATSGGHYGVPMPNGQICEFESATDMKSANSATVKFPNPISYSEFGKIILDTTRSPATVFVCRDEANDGHLEYCVGNEGTSYPTQANFYGLEPGSLMVLSTLRPLFFRQVQLGIEDLSLQRVSIHVYRLVACRSLEE